MGGVCKEGSEELEYH
uniref:Uncharacterized protein n=1 Tax=Arundo donax TaxID=35708 RepID=A0A0A9HRI3_ARUDO